MFLDDLASEIKNLNTGVPVNDDNISILLYADDIALLSLSEEGLQHQLDTLENWCDRWRISVNLDKTSVAHFQKASKPLTEYDFKFHGLFA